VAKLTQLGSAELNKKANALGDLAAFVSSSTSGVVLAGADGLSLTGAAQSSV